MAYKYCGAKKFKGEAIGMYCMNGKEKLLVLQVTSQELFAYIFEMTSKSKHFFFLLQNYVNTILASK